MINKLRSIGLISLFLLLSACGGGSGSSGSNDQSLTSTDTSALSTATATAAGTGTLRLKWVAPVARSDGDALSLSEIASYTVYYGTSAGDYPYSVVIDDPTASALDIPDLPADTYYVVMTTTDTLGLESNYSSVAIKEVKGDPGSGLSV